MAERAKRTPAHLNAGIIVRKGEARPVRPPEQQAETTESAPLPKGTKNTIAITVRLDEARYRRLIAYGAAFFPRRTNQEIMVEALDAYLAQVTEA